MNKIFNNKAWFLVLPVFALVAFNALVPLMTVVNYSVQETFGNNEFFWAGTTGSSNCWRPIDSGIRSVRQIALHRGVLVHQVPLGLAIALSMPRKGPWVSVCLVLMALPLLIPWNVVGSMWNIMALPDIGLLGKAINCHRHTTTTTRAIRSPPGSPLSSWMSGTGPRLSCCSAMPASSPFPMPIIRPPRSTAPGPGRCSVTSSCRSSSMC